MLELWYGLSSIILGVILYFPVRKIIFNISITRYMAKNKKEEITEEEYERIKKRSYIIAGIISMTFAFVYNKIVLLKYITPRGGF